MKVKEIDEKLTSLKDIQSNLDEVNKVLTELYPKPVRAGQIIVGNGLGCTSYKKINIS